MLSSQLNDRIARYWGLHAQNFNNDIVEQILKCNYVPINGITSRDPRYKDVLKTTLENKANKGHLKANLALLAICLGRIGDEYKNMRNAAYYYQKSWQLYNRPDSIISVYSVRSHEDFIVKQLTSVLNIREILELVNIFIRSNHNDELLEIFIGPNGNHSLLNELILAAFSITVDLINQIATSHHNKPQWEIKKILEMMDQLAIKYTNYFFTVEEIDPDLIVIPLIIIAKTIYKDDDKKAISLLKNVNKLGTAEVISLLAESCFKSGRDTEAIFYLEKIIEESNDINAKEFLANIFISQNKIEEAIELLEEIYKIPYRSDDYITKKLLILYCHEKVDSSIIKLNNMLTTEISKHTINLENYQKIPHNKNDSRSNQIENYYEYFITTMKELYEAVAEKNEGNINELLKLLADVPLTSGAERISKYLTKFLENKWPPFTDKKNFNSIFKRFFDPEQLNLIINNKTDKSKFIKDFAENISCLDCLLYPSHLNYTSHPSKLDYTFTTPIITKILADSGDNIKECLQAIKSEQAVFYALIDLKFPLPDIAAIFNKKGARLPEMLKLLRTNFDVIENLVNYAVPPNNISSLLNTFDAKSEEHFLFIKNNLDKFKHLVEMKMPLEDIFQSIASDIILLENNKINSQHFAERFSDYYNVAINTIKEYIYLNNAKRQTLESGYR